MIINPAVGREAQAPRAQPGRCRVGKLDKRLFAGGPRHVDPKVKWRALQQLRPFLAADMARQQ